MAVLDEVLKEASRDGRVCPTPKHWNRLGESLPDRRRSGGGWNPPAPLILAGWWDTTVAEKRKRFHDHIRWADEHGALDAVAELILNLGPDDWHC